MADDNTLSALVRTSFGKGAARKIRANDQIPAVIYGHGTDPQHVTLPGHETMLITRRSNALITLDIEGAQQLALVKDIQRDPVKQVIEHIDLIVVRQGEKVEVDVPVHIEGESAPGTIHVVELNAITLEVSATAIPQSVVVSIEGLEDGAQVHASDVVLPEGASLVTDAEVLITSVSVPQLDLTTDAVDDESGEAAEAEGDVPSIEDEERSE
ncbi:50S ribosomal protein L25/general stress protein Ctc [Frigoribacterium sp. PhB116]|jgi:large subunit ribosomal protein L25|uniref:50S ribosomal protein L25/general stress protein Ctc n=1 Tax=Frigoribacterium sp. PhB116 TaxID=2485174 RepID=UPI00105D86EC|nr:50S ribosomal protein L25/general stress protein Ctc [Frigoribacterium sp. PhB116]TDT64387.1 large subunit ribosomal protein L25 [Frigoribacterium sp. PhB116]